MRPIVYLVKYDDDASLAPATLSQITTTIALELGTSDNFIRAATYMGSAMKRATFGFTLTFTDPESIDALNSTPDFAAVVESAVLDASPSSSNVIVEELQEADPDAPPQAVPSGGNPNDAADGGGALPPGFSAGTVAGIAIGCALAAFLIMGIIMLIIFRRRQTAALNNQPRQLIDSPREPSVVVAKTVPITSTTPIELEESSFRDERQDSDEDESDDGSDEEETGSYGEDEEGSDVKSESDSGNDQSSGDTAEK
jgi:hypothetical protein